MVEPRGASAGGLSGCVRVVDRFAGELPRAGRACLVDELALMVFPEKALAASDTDVIVLPGRVPYELSIGGASFSR